MERRFYNKNGDCVFVGNNTQDNMEQLLLYMWNKYILKMDFIKKVKPCISNSQKASVTFEFLDGTKLVFDNILTEWGQIDLIRMKNERSN